MASATYRSRVRATPSELFAWHERPGALLRLLPPWQGVRLVSRAGGLERGARVELVMPVGPVPTRWVSVHTECDPGARFVDEQERGPFTTWRHEHDFEPEGAGEAWLRDTLTYEVPLGPVGRLADRLAIRRRLDRAFAFRHRRTREDLARHADAGLAPLHVAITGASGLVGTQLGAFLGAAGHRVTALGRRPPRPGADAVQFDPAGGATDLRALEGVDAVIHLAGEPVAQRWTDAARSRIEDSRVEGTRALCASLAALERPPSTLLCASAVGYYGDRGSEELSEDSPPGSSFLARVVCGWEAAADEARAAGIRVVHLRVGVVVTALGGAVKAMLPAFQLGVGGPMGSGAQYVPWIALDDVLGAFLHALADDELRGPVNLVAPEPVPQRAFARALGRVLRRPAVLPAPAAAIRLALGAMGQEVLLEGQRVRPAVLERAGYRFAFPDLEGALRFELGKGVRS